LDEKGVFQQPQELSQNYFGCQQGLAIFVESGYGTGGTAVVTIENNSVHDYDKNGITADGSGTVATITGNYVVGIGATPLIAQNGIQVSDGATGSVKNNTVTDDVYVNPPDCSPNCYGSSGILIFDSGATATSHLAISGNTVSSTQLAVVAYGDSAGTADYNDVSGNKITGTLAAGVYFDDGIDLCSNNNTATGNTVFNSSGAGVHIDSQCTESTGQSGNNTTVTRNTINEACAAVMLGTGSGNITGTGTTLNIPSNVVQVLQPGDSCPAGAPTATKAAAKTRLRAQPRYL
jgi:Right handed beta helix region